jgi:hypothetical protein
VVALGFWLVALASFHSSRNTQAPSTNSDCCRGAISNSNPIPSESRLVSRKDDPAASSRELASLVEKDPLAAAARMVDLTESQQVELAASIASSWGKRAPELAAAWARDQLQGEARDQALLSVSADWAAVNPIAAAECGLSVLSEGRRQEFLKTVGMQWGRQDSAAAIDWGAQLPQDITRDSFLAGISSTLAETSPLKAAQLVASLGDHSLAEETALTVVIEWARQQPEAAADWVKQFPVGHLREQALWNLVSVSSEQSFSLPKPLLLSWPEGPERDLAIRHYLDEVLQVQPGQGVDILSAINNDDLRQEETERLVQHWLMQDPPAARQWLAQTAVPAQSSQPISNPDSAP